MDKKQVQHFDKHFSNINLEKIISSIQKLSFFNELGIENFFKFCKIENKKNDVLIIGSGTGEMEFSMIRSKKYNNIHFYSQDISKESIKNIRYIKKELNIINHDIIESDIANIKQKFDYIICKYVIHHIPQKDMDMFIKNMLKRLNKDGKLCIFEGNGRWPLLRLIPFIDNTYIWKYEKGVKNIKKSLFKKFESNIYSVKTIYYSLFGIFIIKFSFLKKIEKLCFKIFPFLKKFSYNIFIIIKKNY